MKNPWLYELIEEHMLIHGGIHPQKVSAFVDSFMTLLSDRHLAIVPDYLTDRMYQAQHQENQDHDFSMKNKLYRSAILAYTQQRQLTE